MRGGCCASGSTKSFSTVRDTRSFVGPAADRLLVNEVLDSLESDYRLRGVKSWPQFKAHLAPIRVAFGSWRATEVTAEAVDRYIEQRRSKGKADATVNRETHLLGQALRLGVERGQLLSVPTIRRLPERNVRRGFFERSDFEAVVEALPEHLRDLCRFGYLSGWRKGEITGLKWSDVDRDGAVIRLRSEVSKNGRGRVLVIDGDLKELIERRWHARTVLKRQTTRVAELVFHKNARPVGDFRKAWASACKTAEVGDRLFHDLRRTAIRNMVRAGVSERVAMEVSGHRTRSVFDRYNIVSEADLRDAMNKTTNYVRQQPTRSNIVALPAPIPSQT